MRVDVVVKIEKSTLSWFGQVERVDEGRFTKQIYKEGMNGLDIQSLPQLYQSDVDYTYCNEQHGRSDAAVAQQHAEQRQAEKRNRHLQTIRVKRPDIPVIGEEF